MRLLLIDTCGDVGNIALAEGSTIIVVEDLPARAASSSLLPAIQRTLEVAGWSVRDLQGVGVVSGPGSFTGVRVGLAAGKGLCEACGLPMAAVSRLEVLGHVAGLGRGYAVLDAGRGELFVRPFGPEEIAGEALFAAERFLAVAGSGRVAAAETRLMTSLAAVGPELYALSAACALPLVLRAFAAGATGAERADANYVRSEQQIYGKTAPALTPDTVA